MTSYSYSKLSVAIPSQGGTVDFLNRGFGTGTFAGSLSTMLWLAYVVTIALYAHAFGSYCASLFDNNGTVAHLAMTGAILRDDARQHLQPQAGRRDGRTTSSRPRC
ncbi:MAG: hypothetical protein R2695_19740 [Acidimicrobiales bacterium]